MFGLSKVKDAVIDAFLDRAQTGDVPVEIYDNPTEELFDDLGRKGRAKLFMRGRGGGMQAVKSPKRLEENYLYASRRFPSAVDNVIGAGPLAAVSNRFFQNAIGQPGTADGFPTGFVLSSLETNMDVGGQIAQGKNFFLRSIGISFTTESAAADIAQVLDAAALLFSKQGDQYLLRHGPTRLWPGGTGVDGFSGTLAGSAHNGVADPRAVRSLRVPRIIREKESFAYIFDIPRTTRQVDGTAFGLTQFVVATVALWGSQLDLIPG